MLRRLSVFGVQSACTYYKLQGAGKALQENAPETCNLKPATCLKAKNGG